MSDVVFRDYPTVELVRKSANDDDVAHAAWVSTLGARAREGNPERVGGLINFLMRDRHGSPFEHGSFTFLITCPIFVVREYHRHRAGWSYNEMSGRYTELEANFYIPNKDRKLIQTGKPGQYVFTPGTKDQYDLLVKEMTEAAEEAWGRYRRLLDANIAKEVARMVLPLNIYTTFYATCNPRSLMHFLSLRTENENAAYPGHPQFEIQQVANQLEANFKCAMPLTWTAWNKHGRVAP